MNFDHLIFSKKHTKGIAVWWRPDGAGYTSDVTQAGRYVRAEALKIQSGSHGDSIAVPESKLAEMASRTIVDMGDGANWKLLKSLPK